MWLSLVCSSGWCSISLFLSLIFTTTSKVRDWVSILPPSVTLWNAYRDRKDKTKSPDEQMKVPQSFTFMCREGWACCAKVSCVYTILSNQCVYIFLVFVVHQSLQSYSYDLSDFLLEDFRLVKRLRLKSASHVACMGMAHLIGTCFALWSSLCQMAFWARTHCWSCPMLWSWNRITSSGWQTGHQLLIHFWAQSALRSCGTWPLRLLKTFPTWGVLWHTTRLFWWRIQRLNPIPASSSWGRLTDQMLVGANSIWVNRTQGQSHMPWKWLSTGPGVETEPRLVSVADFDLGSQSSEKNQHQVGRFLSFVSWSSNQWVINSLTQWLKHFGPKRPWPIALGYLWCRVLFVTSIASK